MKHQHEHTSATFTQEVDSNQNVSLRNKELFRLTFSATLHCLIGCGIGEVLGMIVSTVLDLNNLHSIILSVILGFIGGLVLGILPLKKFGLSLGKALKVVLAGEGLSIAVMETIEVLTEITIPGVMNAHLGDGIFWLGMAAALLAGFIAAFPVNYIFIKNGIRHEH